MTHGDALLLAHELWLKGETSAAAHDEAARSVGMSPVDFEAVRDFHRKIAARPKEEPLVMCRGVSCRVHGAEDFHAALKPLLEGAGLLGACVDVLCLSQCEHGPNLKLADQVLCTGKGSVVNDNRPWRPVNAGPKPVASVGPGPA